MNCAIVSVWSPLVTTVVSRSQHRIVDDQMRVLQLGGIGGYRADAARDRLKHAVAAVGAAAHDPIGNKCFLAIGALPQHNAAAG